MGEPEREPELECHSDVVESEGESVVSVEEVRLEGEDRSRALRIARQLQGCRVLKKRLDRLWCQVRNRKTMKSRCCQMWTVTPQKRRPAKWWCLLHCHEDRVLSFKAARLVDSDPWALICMIVERELAQVKAVALRSLLEQCPWFWSRAHPWFHAQSPWEPERCPSPVQSESWVVLGARE